ncbi:Os07g0586550 [Oryza sativa Japonica Group]|uniref:Os07g0586550 protein n=1 Tax=Oryza sativa subsp. japonica TaxID=39947 RepID=A0A0P0X840_ORYSJ|nr:hypothetical protein EE612_040362 [Oryza sativa]BAT02397.1 Os07g0586550 [Oryza sativa Japonica Group]
MTLSTLTDTSVLSALNIIKLQKMLRWNNVLAIIAEVNRCYPWNRYRRGCYCNLFFLANFGFSSSITRSSSSSSSTT